MEDAQCSFRAQPTRTRADGVEHNGMSESTCVFARREHARDGARIQRSDVEAEPCAKRGDLLHLLGIVRHDGTCTDGEQDIRDIVDGDVVGDAVDERGCRANLFEG